MHHASVNADVAPGRSRDSPPHTDDDGISSDSSVFSDASQDRRHSHRNTNGNDNVTGRRSEATHHRRSSNHHDGACSDTGSDVLSTLSSSSYIDSDNAAAEAFLPRGSPNGRGSVGPSAEAVDLNTSPNPLDDDRTQRRGGEASVSVAGRPHPDLAALFQYHSRFGPPLPHTRRVEKEDEACCAVVAGNVIVVELSALAARLWRRLATEAPDMARCAPRAWYAISAAVCVVNVIGMAYAFFVTFAASSNLITSTVYRVAMAPDAGLAIGSALSLGVLVRWAAALAAAYADVLSWPVWPSRMAFGTTHIAIAHVLLATCTAVVPFLFVAAGSDLSASLLIAAAAGLFLWHCVEIRDQIDDARHDHAVRRFTRDLRRGKRAAALLGEAVDAAFVPLQGTAGQEEGALVTSTSGPVPTLPTTPLGMGSSRRRSSGSGAVSVSTPRSRLDELDRAARRYDAASAQALRRRRAREQRLDDAARRPLAARFHLALRPWATVRLALIVRRPGGHIVSGVAYLIAVAVSAFAGAVRMRQRETDDLFVGKGFVFGILAGLALGAAELVAGVLMWMALSVADTRRSTTAKAAFSTFPPNEEPQNSKRAVTNAGRPASPDATAVSLPKRLQQRPRVADYSAPFLRAGPDSPAPASSVGAAPSEGAADEGAGATSPAAVVAPTTNDVPADGAAPRGVDADDDDEGRELSTFARSPHPVLDAAAVAAHTESVAEAHKVDRHARRHRRRVQRHLRQPPPRWYVCLSTLRALSAAWDVLSLFLGLLFTAGIGGAHDAALSYLLALLAIGGFYAVGYGRPAMAALKNSAFWACCCGTDPQDSAVVQRDRRVPSSPRYMSGSRPVSPSSARTRSPGSFRNTAATHVLAVPAVAADTEGGAATSSNEIPTASTARSAAGEGEGEHHESSAMVESSAAPAVPGLEAPLLIHDSAARNDGHEAEDEREMAGKGPGHLVVAMDTEEGDMAGMAASPVTSSVAARSGGERPHPVPFPARATDGGPQVMPYVPPSGLVPAEAATAPRSPRSPKGEAMVPPRSAGGYAARPDAGGSAVLPPLPRRLRKDLRALHAAAFAAAPVWPRLAGYGVVMAALSAVLLMSVFTTASPRYATSCPGSMPAPPERTRRYAVCNADFFGTAGVDPANESSLVGRMSVVDFAAVASMTYMTSTVQNASIPVYFPDEPAATISSTLTSHSLFMGVQYLVLHLPKRKMTFVAIRGSYSSIDWLENLYLMSDSVFIQLAQLPLPVHFSRGAAASVVTLFARLFKFGIRDYPEDVVRTVRRIQAGETLESINSNGADGTGQQGAVDYGQLFIVGHSLGGFTANVVGPQTDTPTFTFSPVGTGYDTGRFDFSVAAADRLIFSVVPEGDIIPKIDYQLGMQQRIHQVKPCLLGGCHSLSLSMETVAKACGDPLGRGAVSSKEEQLAAARKCNAGAP